MMDETKIRQERSKLIERMNPEDYNSLHKKVWENGSYVLPPLSGRSCLDWFDRFMPKTELKLKFNFQESDVVYYSSEPRGEGFACWSCVPEREQYHLDFSHDRISILLDNLRWKKSQGEKWIDGKKIRVVGMGSMFLYQYLGGENNNPNDPNDTLSSRRRVDLASRNRFFNHPVITKPFEDGCMSRVDNLAKSLVEFYGVQDFRIVVRDDFEKVALGIQIENAKMRTAYREDYLRRSGLL